jgi:hypothetical protein
MSLVKAKEYPLDVIIKVENEEELNALKKNIASFRKAKLRGENYPYFCIFWDKEGAADFLKQTEYRYLSTRYKTISVDELFINYFSTTVYKIETKELLDKFLSSSIGGKDKKVRFLLDEAFLNIPYYAMYCAGLDTFLIMDNADEEQIKKGGHDFYNMSAIVARETAMKKKTESAPAKKTCNCNKWEHVLEDVKYIIDTDLQAGDLSLDDINDIAEASDKELVTIAKDMESLSKESIAFGLALFMRTVAKMKKIIDKNITED